MEQICNQRKNLASGCDNCDGQQLLLCNNLVSTAARQREEMVNDGCRSGVEDCEDGR